jgi:carbon storage regulator
MLVLSRKVDEQIIIGDNIRVTVVSIRGNQVRLGFEAPPSVPIFREELKPEFQHQPLPQEASRGHVDSLHTAPMLITSSES